MTADTIRQMAPTELRIKVAMAAGWVYEGHGNWRTPKGDGVQALYPSGGVGDVVVGLDNYDSDVPPNFSQHANAMYSLLAELMDYSDREAKERGAHSKDEFLFALSEIIYGTRNRNDWRYQDMVFASPLQLAQAYVLMKATDRDGGVT